MTNAWLASIEAESQASQHNYDTCLKALEEAERIEDQHSSEDNYLIHFDRALLEGYQGACFRRLYCADDTRSAVYLEKAQSVLMDALSRLEPASIQRQPTFLTDLADISIQKGEIEEACERAVQAVTVARQIKLQKVVQRLFTLRHELEPWKNTPYVKALDEHLVPLLTPG